MSDPVVRLNAALEGRYQIERELGEGGMATVYLADDLKHERKVALKVLKPELAAVVGAERFLAEIKTTANLQHPHILPLFDSGEADSFLFYVMPYVEGETLRDRIKREKQLPVDEAVRIATAVANALDHAHRHKVIHRDIKPANILLQDGEPVVSDFGIALAMGAGGGDRLTETGLSLGTPYYMSPEQATGDEPVGPPSDMYALGCILYEMLVGEPPYVGSSAQAVLGKIIQSKSVSPKEHRASVPANVDAAVRRALEILPADRFTSAQEFVRALGDEHFRYGEAVAGLAGADSGLWKRLSIGLATLAAVLGTGWFWFGGGLRSASVERSIAVLPFDDLSREGDQQYFVEGLSEAIINALSQIGDLKVAARTSTFLLAEQGTDIATVARTLGVANVLEGSVRKSGNQIRITAQLIDAESGFHLWSDTFDRELTDIFAIQDAIARAIAERLQVTVVAGDQTRLATEATESTEGRLARQPPTTSQEAYDYYLRGENYFRRTSFTEAIAAYERAVQLDPDFAEAWAKLAEVGAFAYFLPAHSGTIEETEAALERARRLAPEAAETYLAEGAVRMLVSSAYDEAIQSFTRARELRPGAVEPLYYLGIAHTLPLRLDEAAELIQLALDLDPLNSGVVWQMGLIHAVSGSFQEARRYYDRAIALAPDASMIFGQRWDVYMWGLGDTTAASQLLEDAPSAYSTVNIQAWLAYVRRDTTALEALFEERDDPTRFRYEWLARLHRLRGDLARQEVYGDSMRLVAEEIVREAIENEEAPVFLEWERSRLAVALALAGDEQQAIRTIESSVEQVAAQPDLLNAVTVHYNAIRTYTFLGRTDTAIERIDSLFSRRRGLGFTPNRLRLDPDFDPLRGHPGFAALLRRYGGAEGP